MSILSQVPHHLLLPAPPPASSLAAIRPATAFAGHRRHRARGFTLLEVLIALLVLALGLLGLAALQSVSLKYNHQSYERTQATLLAYDMLDRMRANPQGNYTITPPTSDTDCITTSCTPDNLAQHDLFHWSQAVTASLASSSTTINMVTATRTATITVGWLESDIPQNFTLVSRL